MTGRDGTYFFPEQCLNAHFIITGMTNDLFCSESGIPLPLRDELSLHLRKQGFDAVIFLDNIYMIYCRDTQSWQVLREGRPPRETPPPSRGDISAKGSCRRRMRRRTGAASPRRDTPPSGAPPALNMGRMRERLAWDRVTSLMRSPDIRCAFVFPSADTMPQQFLPSDLQTLEELSAGQVGGSIAVYIYPENTLLDLLRNVESGMLGAFMRRHVVSERPDENYVLTLGPPNAGEIRNLLTWMRLRERTPAAVRGVAELSRLLAAFCARERLPLRKLQIRLEEYLQAHPDGVMEPARYAELTGDRYAARPALEQLENLIGLEPVKAQMRARFQRMRQRGGGPLMPRYASRFAPPPNVRRGTGFDLNYVIKGGPGTGKSTVARLLGRIYYECGVLPTDHLREISAGELIAGYVGQTAQNVRRAVAETLGGVLFIDEAYGLTRTDSPFGQEAVDQLVAEMSAHEGELAVVLAGYPGEMDDFLNANAGLPRRFPNQLLLPDYEREQMRDLLLRFAEEDPDGVAFADSLVRPTRRDNGTERSMLDDFCDAWRDSKEGEWQNAGEARTLLDQMKRRYSMRAAGQDGGRILLSEEDVPEELRFCLAPRSQNLDEAWKKIDGLLGLKTVKRFLRELAKGVSWGAAEKIPGNYIFSGPPGTGKTYVARLMGELLYLLNVLKRRHVTERKAADLLTEDPVAALRDAVNAARRGILFIDEAHQLADTPAGRGVLRALVPIIEDPEIRADTGFILAGYTAEMGRLLDVDSGLSRRFPENHRIRFSDYTAHELRQILELFARERGYLPDDGYLDRSEAALSVFLTRRPENFGNAGYIRDTYLPDSAAMRTERLNRKYADGDGVAGDAVIARVEEAEKRTLTAEDVPLAFQRYAPPDAKPGAETDAFQRLRRELVGKQEIADFALSFRTSPKSSGFRDSTGGAGTMHYALSGPPGCGRRTAVRLLSAAFAQLGLLETAHVRFVSRGDLEAEYVGQTVPKTQTVINESAGGTLVILSPGAMLPERASGTAFGPEALSTVISNLNAHMSDMSIVFLDSAEGMERFLTHFPGVRSLLAREFSLEDLLPEEMEQIFRMRTSDSFAFAPDVEALLPDFFLNWVSRRGGLREQWHRWGNGTEVDRLITELRQRWELQDGAIDTTGDSPRRLITMEMFPETVRPFLVRTRADSAAALRDLDRLTGLRRVKEAVRDIERRIRLRGAGNVSPGLYCFLGNPGTGKTTVARLMGGVLRDAHVLSQGHVVERKAQDFLQNPETFGEAVRLARNGILFLDEAHELAQYHTGLTVIHQILTVLEDTAVTRNTCIILAGYPRPMERLLELDSGLRSRFGTANSLLYFDDYTPEELCSILTAMAAKADRMPEIGAAEPLELSEEYLRESRRILERVCAERDSDFGNARWVRNYLHDSLDRMTARMDTGGERIQQDALRAGDIPARFRAALDEMGTARIPARAVSTQSAETKDGIEQQENCVVLLEFYEGRDLCASGTGSIVTEDGIILTCRHVAEAPGDIAAYLRWPGIPGGKPLQFPCRRLRPMFEDCDMALLKMDGVNFPALSLRPPTVPVVPEEQIWMFGFSLGSLINGGDASRLHPTRYNGAIASIQTMDNGMERCYMDARGTRGNSGSPVFSSQDGRVIGVFSGSIKPDDEEINYFYPIRYFWERFTFDQTEKGGPV